MKKRLLIVDDEETFAGLVGEFFIDRGYDVSIAHNYSEAVRLTHKLAPAIVISDIRMPGGSGYDVAEHVRQTRDAGVVIVIMTAYGVAYDAARLADLHVDGFLQKPFHLQKLYDLVEEKAALHS